MSVRFKSTAWLFGLALCFSDTSLAETALPSDLPISRGELGVSARSDAGSAAAGTICLPKGRLKIADFAPDDSAIDAALSRGLRRSGTRIESPGLFKPGVEIRAKLMKIDGKLCNKSYGPLGLGNTKIFVGKLSITFQWEVVTSKNNIIKGTSVIFTEYKKKDSKTFGEMLDGSLDSLLQRVSQVIEST